MTSDTLNELLPGFSEKSRARLLHLLNQPGFTGHILAAEVETLADREQQTVDGLMLALLPLARTYSRPPISNFHVGAIARGISGNLYFGANLEVPGHSLGFSVHAEQSALSNAYMHADQGVSSIAVTAAPCGHCRQFMNELLSEGDIRILIDGNPATMLASLLPMAFGPKNLGVRYGAFPVQTADLILPATASDELTAAALEAARKSYAPYSKAHSGVGIETKNHRVFQGSYLENAAFNPSLSPLQAALAALVVAGEGYGSIARATLVEITGAVISQESVTQAALADIAPAAKLQIVHAAAA